MKDTKFDNKLEDTKFDNKLEDTKFDSKLEDTKFDENMFKQPTKFDSKLKDTKFDENIISSIALNTPIRAYPVSFFTIQEQNIVNANNNFIQTVERHYATIGNYITHENRDEYVNTITNNRLLAYNQINLLNNESLNLDRLGHQLLGLGALYQINEANDNNAINETNNNAILNTDGVQDAQMEQVRILRNEIWASYNRIYNIVENIGRLLGENQAIFAQRLRTFNNIDTIDFGYYMSQYTRRNPSICTWEQFRDICKQAKDNYRG